MIIIICIIISISDPSEAEINGNDFVSYTRKFLFFILFYYYF